MQSIPFAVMTGAVEKSDFAIYHILIEALPQMEYPVKCVGLNVVVMAIAYQLIRMFFQILGKNSHNHAPHLFVGRTATLPFGKIEHEVKHAMTTHLCYLNKMKYIKTTRGIVKRHR